jgi:segregation and condensation protein B
MSLKAKIEAVIYASEEPVTLSQLMGLLAEEGQAELDELASQQQSLQLETADESDAAADSAAELNDASPMDSEQANSSEEDAAAPASSDASEKRLAREREKTLRAHFRSLLDSLIAEYANGDRGLEVREVANGFRFATKPEYHDAVRGFVKSLKPPLKLTLQALETLAVIAYKQPVTAPEISEIRGVDSGGVIGSLMSRKLVAAGGRKQVIGRPILYKTTRDFLLRFGLKDISELPSIEEFEKMAGELNEAIQEEIPMEETPMRDAAPDTDENDAVESDGSGSVDEIHAAPEATNIAHVDVEDMLSDKSTQPEGAKTEHADPREVEPQAEQHPPQADGDSTEPASWTDSPQEPDSIEAETAGGSKTGGA